MKTNKEFFYNVNDRNGTFILLSLLTFGLPFIFWYTRFNHRKYFLNRRKLLELLKNGDINLEYQGNALKGVDEYFFDYGDEKYVIWHYYQTDEFTLSLLEWNNFHKSWLHTSNPNGFDLIGLFRGDLIEKNVCKKITKFFKRNNYF